MSDNETTELQKEWREAVREGMKETSKKLDRVLAEIAKIRSEFATVDKHEDLAERVRSLEENQAKFLGGMIILNIVGGFAMAIIMKIWK